jgi:enoyl-CoA hydratase
MIDIERRGPIAIARLQHGKVNALDLELCEAIAACIEGERRSPARALVVTGQGSVFGAGVDLLRVLEGGRAYTERFMPALVRAFDALFFLPKPVVAAVNGHAIAGGCVLACACDRRLMARGNARIGVPELLVGVPFPTLALEIMRLVATPQAFRSLVYGGKTLLPEEALQHGLVDAVVEPDALLERAVVEAEALAAIPAEAFELAKRQIHAPALQRVREDGAERDAAVQASWGSPETLGAIERYVARTFKRPRG